MGVSVKLTNAIGRSENVSERPAGQMKLVQTMQLFVVATQLLYGTVVCNCCMKASAVA